MIQSILDRTMTQQFAQFTTLNRDTAKNLTKCSGWLWRLVELTIVTHYLTYINCHAVPYLHQLSRTTLLTSIVTHYLTYINCHALPYLHQLSRTTLLTSIVTHYLTYINCHALPYLHQLSRTTLLTSNDYEEWPTEPLPSIACFVCLKVYGQYFSD